MRWHSRSDKKGEREFKNEHSEDDLSDEALSSPEELNEGEHVVTNALEKGKRNPRSRIYDFEHSSQLRKPVFSKKRQRMFEEKTLDIKGGDVLIQLRALPEDLPHHYWLNFATILLQVKRSSGPDDKKLYEHYEKHPRVLAVAVNGRTEDEMLAHIEDLIERWAYNLPLPAPTPEFEER